MSTCNFKCCILSIIFLGIFGNSVDCETRLTHIPLTLGETTDEYTTHCGEYKYFEIEVEDACDDLNIQVNRIAGEPNLYVSKPPVTLPTYESLSWSSYQWGSENLTIRSWDPNFSPGKFYIAVHAYCGPDVKTKEQAARYTVLVQTIPHTHPRTDDIFNKTVSGEISAHEYKYHRFCIPTGCYKVNITLDSCNDPNQCPHKYSYPELIISPSEQFPSVNSYGWLLGESEHRSIILTTQDQTVKSGHYYVSVYGWCTPDHLCPDEMTCGPCKYVNRLPYKISVAATPIGECTTDGNGSTSEFLSFTLLSAAHQTLLAAAMALAL